MKVKAIKNGFYDMYRRPGDVFNIKDKSVFSKNWMEVVEQPKATAKPKATAEPKVDAE